MNINITRTSELDTDNTAVYDCSPVPFCFVGPRGVGKTSLLASMYQQLKTKRVKNFFINLMTEEGKFTQSALDEAHLSMLEMIDETEMHAIVEELGIGGSADRNDFEFTGRYTIPNAGVFQLKDNVEFLFRFRFTDMPGKWYNEGDEHNSEACQILSESLVSFLAVDTPALMEGPATNKRNNKQDLIENWYNTSITKLADNKHSVIIVLSRCEAFWDRNEEMLEKLNESYGSLITSLKERGIKVFVTWVQTLGGIQFDHYEKRVAKFIRTGNYVPENCATPLQLALSHGLSHAASTIQATVNDEGIIAFILRILGFNNANQLALKAAESLAKELENNLHSGDTDTYKEL